MGERPHYASWADVAANYLTPQLLVWPRPSDTDATEKTVLRLTNYSDAPLCVGYTWEVIDEAALAEVVAWLILGEHLYAREILQRLDRDIPVARRRHLDKRIAEFATPPANDAARWHRDGWLFQMMSWIATQQVAPGDALIRAPQPRKADKGLDGLVVHMAGENGPAFLVICEDKATENARSTITNKVWPEIDDFEAERRDGEVVSEVGALLDRIADEVTRKEIIKQALWSEPWHYRVAITIEGQHHGTEGRASLFQGFESRVTDPLRRRRAETILIPAMRVWMDRFSDRVATELTAIRDNAGV